MTLFLPMVCLLPLPVGGLLLAKEANMNREKKPHIYSQYFKLWGDIFYSTRKVFSKITQCNFDHPKPMIFDEVLFYMSPDCGNMVFYENVKPTYGS